MSTGSRPTSKFFSRASVGHALGPTVDNLLTTVSKTLTPMKWNSPVDSTINEAAVREFQAAVSTLLFCMRGSRFDCTCCHPVQEEHYLIP
jgi:hypothetical protein